jgi:rubrerythrin
MTTEATQEVLKAFKIGMDTELYGLETYLKFARKTSDETGKNMFITLAGDELEHYRILRRAFNNTELGENLGSIEISESIIQRITPKLRDRDSRIKGEKGMDQVNALTTALDQERRSIELYRQQLGKSIAPEARKIFRQLMEMEESHYDLIQAELDNINETGFWFQIPEFDLED